jgi:hypothetical protein
MQLSWIDADNLRDLAAKLQDPTPDPVPTPIPPSTQAPLLPYASAPHQEEIPAESFPNDTQLARIREQLQSIRDKAVKAGLLSSEPIVAPPPVENLAAQDPVDPPAPVQKKEAVPEPESPPAAEPPTAPVDAMSVRLNDFAHSAMELTRSDELLLIDQQGGLLWSNSSNPELTISATLSLTTALRASAQGTFTRPGVIRNRLSHDMELSVLPCETKHGTVILALVNARSVAYETVNKLRASLIQAIEG